MYAQRGLKIASRLLQDCLLEPIWTQLGPKLAPSWLKLGPSWLQLDSSWTHVGPKLAPIWLKLGPGWAQLRVPKAAPGPTQAIPETVPVASWFPKPLQDPKWTLKRCPRPTSWGGVWKTQCGAVMGLPKPSTWTLQDRKIGSTKCVT